MDLSAALYALLGGVLIGCAAGLFLILNGRIAGISGIVAGILVPKEGVPWRLAFVAGLLAGGLGLSLFYPAAFPSEVDSDKLKLIVAGLLVGVGTRLGGGCTSGHGVCGIPRMSGRSFVATLSFMAAGMATVFIVGVLRG